MLWGTNAGPRGALYVKCAIKVLSLQMISGGDASLLRFLYRSRAPAAWAAHIV